MKGKNYPGESKVRRSVPARIKAEKFALPFLVFEADRLVFSCLSLEVINPKGIKHADASKLF